MSPRRDYTVSAVICCLAALLPAAFMVFKLGLLSHDLNIPLRYGHGDSLTAASFMKAILDKQWSFENKYLGMPFKLVLYDYPLPQIHFIIGKLLSLFFDEYPIFVNVYYLLSVSLISLSAFLVSRAFGLSHLSSLVCTLTFALLPAQIIRGTSHLFLATYYCVPLAFFLALSAVQRNKLRPSISELIACIVIALSDMYYVAGGIVTVVVAGVASSVRARTLRPAMRTAVLVSCVLAVVAAAYSPSVYYQMHYGHNPQILQRGPGGVLRAGLDLGTLVVPWTQGLIAPNSVREVHASLHTGSHEAKMVYVGLIGILGMVVLGLQLLGGSPMGSGPVGFVLATAWAGLFVVSVKGGLAYVLSLFAPIPLRTWSRLSVYLAFASILAFLLFWERRVVPSLARRFLSRASGLLLAGLVALSIADQTRGWFDQDYPTRAKKFNQDTAFVKKMTEVLPSGAAILQLPHAPLVDNKTMYRMHSYEHLRLYLASSDFRWSFGAMNGRPANQWLESAQEAESPSLPLLAAAVGFDAIYVDRFGYADSARALLIRLAEESGTNPILDLAGRRVLVDLRPIRDTYTRRYGSNAWESLRAESSVAWSLGVGFHFPREKDAKWPVGLGQCGELLLCNFSDKAITADLKILARSTLPNSATVSSKLGNQLIIFRFSTQEEEVSLPIEIAPGESVLKMHLDYPTGATEGSNHPLLISGLQLTSGRWSG